MIKKLTRREASAGIAVGAAALFAGADALADTPAFVDLTADQTPRRDQHGRYTCITFGALAALEAALYRAGHGKIDLSEQFLNHIGKTT